MSNCIRIYYNGYLMNTITPSSTFVSFYADCSTPKGRERAAKEIMEGWIKNAGYDRKLFKIEQGDLDPCVLSKATVEMLK